MFADHTNLFMSGKNLDEIELKLNEELIRVTQWFMQVNLLSLNVSKTSYIIFGNKSSRNLKLISKKLNWNGLWKQNF